MAMIPTGGSFAEHHAIQASAAKPTKTGVLSTICNVCNNPFDYLGKFLGNLEIYANFLSDKRFGIGSYATGEMIEPMVSFFSNPFDYLGNALEYCAPVKAKKE